MVPDLRYYLLRQPITQKPKFYYTPQPKLKGNGGIKYLPLVTLLMVALVFDCFMTKKFDLHTLLVSPSISHLPHHKCKTNNNNIPTQKFYIMLNCVYHS